MWTEIKIVLIKILVCYFWNLDWTNFTYGPTVDFCEDGTGATIFIKLCNLFTSQIDAKWWFSTMKLVTWLIN
jgi:hypothetical protein